MVSETPFNPLDKTNLGVSVADALLARPLTTLPPERFEGAGIYAIYYRGKFAPYRKLALEGGASPSQWAIYVGKAVPKGARKGGFGLGAKPGRVLCDRLRKHANSIDSAKNLRLEDFLCRFLAVEDIWIPLGESLLIERLNPLWNRVVDGFGNNDPGSGRQAGRRSAWDVLHPGREFAERLADGRTESQILEAIDQFFDRKEPPRGEQSVAGGAIQTPESRKR